ncbi:DNA-binding transcriptional regulator, LysR family [Pasteurella testudinis DSM 23072]|uniref:DNA-binding transcriptional regulator, LysR family n=1 Tax=Pasteurella testudinis DSM 23072 TaxID=1122938 RepID=A0A1W1V785_9PAST|nr:LysR family transcriptional regulator [Pasteurella testudinis]SMB89222.1 DNA-binding transcriptional regulator, LysR family [Pasteurella testudinis DSM 23072]SUB52963.1 glycine cleavage system transcriptional activator [Pasteurella testudinis]
MIQQLKNITSFVQAAESGSFTLAAQQLDLSPAAVSRNVAMLEQHLQVRLFNRTTRSLSLTDEGQAFAVRAKQILTLLDEAAAHVQSNRRAVAGTVKMSMANVIARRLVMPLIPELQRCYPHIDVEINFDDQMIDFVQGGYDLVLRVGVLENSTLVARHICRLHNVLAASPAYLAACGTPQNVADLARHRLIARRFSSGKLKLWQFRQGDSGIYPYEFPRRILTLSDPESIADAAVNGLGIAEVRGYIARQALQSGRLLPILPAAYHSDDSPLVLQYPHRTLLAPRVQAVVDFLLQKLAQQPDLQRF